MYYLRSGFRKIGKQLVEVLPFLGLLGTSILPPSASISILAIANPRSMLFGFQVKSGSKCLGISPVRSFFEIYWVVSFSFI